MSESFKTQAEAFASPDGPTEEEQRAVTDTVRAVRKATIGLSSSQHPKTWTVPRATFDLIESAFGHWPVQSETGEWFLGNFRFVDQKEDRLHMWFKGMRLYPEES